MAIEIYWNENRTILISEDILMGKSLRLDEWESVKIQEFDSAIASQRPKAYKALCTETGYGPQYAYNRVYQFSACNFSTMDGRADIDADFNLTVERVPCPIRHKCTAGYCSNETILSDREIDILRQFARGSDDDAIGVKLFIAKATVHNHINNIYHKLGFTGQPHPDRLLLNYAYTNKII